MRREVSYDEVFDAQHHFRIILDGMARPGKIKVLDEMDIQPPAGLNQASAIIAMALLNTDATFYAEGENSVEIESYIALNTAAQPVSVGEADFIFIAGTYNAEIIFEAKTGTLPYPEESATFVLDVQEISAAPKDDVVMLTMKGPGIESETIVYIKGINAEILEGAREQNLEFPLGIDLIITDRQNKLMCIPRSNQFVIDGAEKQIKSAIL